MASRYFAPTKVSTIAAVLRRWRDMALPPFHLAFPVDDHPRHGEFYGGLLGCPEGRVPTSGSTSTCTAIRSSPIWRLALPARASNEVDREHVPVPHFGLVLRDGRMESARRAGFKMAGMKFVIEPTVRFQGQPGEQATMFLLDPAGNRAASSRRWPIPPACSRGIRPARLRGRAREGAPG